METQQTDREDKMWSQSKSLLLHHKERITGFLILIIQGLKRIYVAYIFWLQLNRSSEFIIKKPISGEELCETSALTPMLRSGYPPCAAVSLVVLSPTRDGRVCDIQLVIIAMVLSTTPIFSKGTVIFALCSGTLFRLSSFYRLRWDTRETSRVAQSGLLFHPGHRLGCAFLGHLQRKYRRTSRTREGWPKQEDRDGGKTGKTSSRHRKRCRCWKRPRNSSSLSALSRTVLPLRSTLTISFTPDGLPPVLVRSVIKCHWLHTYTYTWRLFQMDERRKEEVLWIYLYHKTQWCQPGCSALMVLNWDCAWFAYSCPTQAVPVTPVGNVSECGWGITPQKDGNDLLHAIKSALN